MASTIAASDFHFDDVDSGTSTYSSSCVSPVSFMLNSSGAQFMTSVPRASSTPSKENVSSISSSSNKSVTMNLFEASKNAEHIVMVDNVNPSLNRNALFMRSMFERRPSERRSKLQQRFCLADDIRAQQASLVKREAELNMVADEAIRQVEQILRLRDNCNELLDENAALKEEVSNLRDALDEAENEIDKKDAELDEMIEYRTQLQKQLESGRHKLAQYRLQTERMKVENSVFSSSMSNLTDGGSDLVESEELQEVRKERDDLLHKLQETRGRMDELQRENVNIRGVMQQLKETLEKEKKDINKEERSKDELLRVIRHSVEDKMVWEQYAAQLISKIITEMPDLLDCNVRSVDNAMHCCHVDRAWEAYALKLQKVLVEHAPELANSFLDKDPRKQSISSLTANRSVSLSTRKLRAPPPPTPIVHHSQDNEILLPPTSHFINVSKRQERSSNAKFNV